MTDLSKHTLGEQPNDHLNLIMGLLDAQSLYRLMRVSRRMALFAPRHLPAVQARHDQVLKDALTRTSGPPWIEPELRAVLEKYCVPGVTTVRCGYEWGNQITSTLPSHLIRDTHVETIAKGCGEALRVLSIGRGTIRDSLTDQAANSIARRCTNLVELDINAHQEITHEGLVAIFDRNPHLATFRAQWCDLADCTVKALVIRCPHITTLDVGWCDRITDVAIKEVATRCKRLKSLNVNSCRFLTRQSIEAVAMGCPALTNLHICRDNFTDQTIEMIAQGCPHLSEIDMGENREITDRAVQALAAGCPRLTVLRARYTNLTDCSLHFLMPLQQLTTVLLTGSEITEQGQAEFDLARPGILVGFMQPIGDLH